MSNNGLSLSPILSDGMVLQRDTFNHIYGTETIADMVTVQFMNKKYTARVDKNHEFSVELPPTQAGGPYSITVCGSNEIILKDVLFGDVYILSGQSNMELPICRVLDVSAEEIKNTCEYEIRQYLIPATYNFSEPNKYMYASEWKKAAGDDLMGFSAVGFFFAKEIKETYHIPVGLILTAIGGSRIEAWMNPATLKRFGDFDTEIQEFKDINYFNSYIQNQQNQADEWLARLEDEEQKVTDTEDITKWNTCKVPSLVSDYGKGNFQGSVYLCKDVILDSEPVNEDAYIYMGCIIDSDQVWINGNLIGRTEYKYPPRKYPVPKGILKKGNNRIMVRIVINDKNGGTIKDKPYHLFYDGKKINLEGEWFYRVAKKAETPLPSVLWPPNLPVGFYNTVVVPLSKISVAGILWYQGESNIWDPRQYSEKFEAMVTDWRKLYRRDIPFLYVQLSNFLDPIYDSTDTGWAEIREHQRQNLSMKKVAMVVSLDVGESNDIHPQNKKAVGMRLAKAARYLIYNETLEYSGPLPKVAKRIGNSAKIRFEHLDDAAEKTDLNNFELAGTDGVYHKALAILNEDYVTVSCDKVDVPVSVRYCWCDDPTDVNFYNNAGLPATGFRMDITS